MVSQQEIICEVALYATTKCPIPKSGLEPNLSMAVGLRRFSKHPKNNYFANFVPGERACRCRNSTVALWVCSHHAPLDAAPLAHGMAFCFGDSGEFAPRSAVLLKGGIGPSKSRAAGPSGSSSSSGAGASRFCEVVLALTWEPPQPHVFFCPSLPPSLEHLSLFLGFLTSCHDHEGDSVRKRVARVFVAKKPLLVQARVDSNGS